MSSPAADHLSAAVDLLRAMTALPPTVELDALAARLGWPRDEQAATLAALERAGVVESWPDPRRLGSTRVMLSARSISAIGLKLSASGDCWRLARHARHA
jgi:DNA-binding IclR family transcriptional regulator